MDITSSNAATLALDLLRNGFHLPLVDGKANRDNIEDTITVAMMAGDLVYYIDEDIVNIAVRVINDLIEKHRVTH